MGLFLKLLHQQLFLALENLDTLVGKVCQRDLTIIVITVGIQPLKI